MIRRKPSKWVPTPVWIERMLGVSLAKAEFIAALESGEIPGDVLLETQADGERRKTADGAAREGYLKSLIGPRNRS